jgi:hypothetical protein
MTARALLCLALVACSSGPAAPHPKAVESTTGNAPTLPSPEAGSTVVEPPDAGPPADDAAPAACNDLTLIAVPVTEEARSGLTTPKAVGGAIPPGTYLLIERDFFPDAADEGASLDTSAVASSIVFDGTTMKTITGTDGAAPQMAAATYAVFDTVLSSTESCPTPKETTNRFFSVQDGQVWVFPDRARRWVYSTK